MFFVLLRGFCSFKTSEAEVLHPEMKQNYKYFYNYEIFDLFNTSYTVLIIINKIDIEKFIVKNFRKSSI